MLHTVPEKQYLIAEVNTIISAPVAKVWEALTTPELIKEYLFDTNIITDWQTGSPIYWEGEWRGSFFTDKGTILTFVPGQLLRHTYLSSLSGKRDLPENYSIISYELAGDSLHTSITITQNNIDTEAGLEKMNEHWAKILMGLQYLVEKSR